MTTDKTTMRAGKRAIATALGCDMADLEPYQSTQSRSVFTDGALYYFCAKSKQKLPIGWEWMYVNGTEWFNRMYGLSIYCAVYRPAVST